MAAAQTCALGAFGSTFLSSGGLSSQLHSTSSGSSATQHKRCIRVQRKQADQSHVNADLREESAGRVAQTRLSRRALGSLAATTVLWLQVAPGQARERRQPKVDISEYKTSEEGLKYYDFNQGKGPEAVKGKKVVVHFDCVYKTLTVVSSRSSKLLGGNRIIAEPYELIVGSKPGSERKRDFVDNANGLFSAQASPKPPPALYSIVEGMRVGGKRTVMVPPEFGYGQKGIGEIPPGATFELNIELLDVENVRKET